MKVIVFLLFAGAASAGHVPEEQFNTRVKGDVVIERSNDGYRSQNPESKPYVNSGFRQADIAVRTKTNQRFVQSTVKYNVQNHEDSLNNINNYENDHRLRTNAYTTEVYSTTQYVLQEVNVYTNRKEQKYKEDRNPVNQGAIAGQVSQQVTYNVGYIKCNEHKLIPDNRPAVTYNQERRRPETSVIIPIQNPQNEKKYVITNHPKKPSVLETVLIHPIPTEKPREEIDRLPKTDTDDQIWSWGTEGTLVITTEPGSLDDRAAFTGDQCPTGKAKVKGICVEKH